MRLRHVVMLVMLAMTIGCSGSSAQPARPAAAPTNDVLPFKATETTLPNGLRVIVVPTGFPNLVRRDRETKSSRESPGSRTSSST
jgi:hypothetical protein